MAFVVAFVFPFPEISSIASISGSGSGSASGARDVLDRLETLEAIDLRRDDGPGVSSSSVTSILRACVNTSRALRSQIFSMKYVFPAMKNVRKLERLLRRYDAYLGVP